RTLLERPCELTTHPSGFLLTRGPVEQYAPLQKYRGGGGLTQLDMKGVEAIGLIKIDLLSSRALSTLAEARGHLDQLVGVESAPAEDADPPTLALLAQGDTLGIGQLETPGMRLLLRQLRPRSLQDLAQALAVARPAAASLGGKETFLKRKIGVE